MDHRKKMGGTPFQVSDGILIYIQQNDATGLYLLISTFLQSLCQIGNCITNDITIGDQPMVTNDCGINNMLKTTLSMYLVYTQKW